jgi:uncharacterized pyridoxamine 5'-phosphate oxidase family protein
MSKISPEVINFLNNQGFVVVSTIDSQGSINSSAKGIVKVEEEGKVYLIDLYRASTFSNLRNNPTVTITAIDERRFKGYSLKGKAQIVESKDLHENILKEWEDKVVSRISKRLISNIQEDKKASHHPEARLPEAKYLIVMSVEQVIDLTPAHLKRS